MTNTTSVSGIPPAVVERAKQLHINISEVCRTALMDEVEKMEKHLKENGE